MPLTEYIILGILQGILEWLPISSEGVTALASNYLIQDLNPIDVAVFLHLGTLLAVLIYFRKDWLNIVKGKDKGLLIFIIITTILTLIIGYPLFKLVRNVAIGSTLLLITGVTLLFTSYFNLRKRVTFVQDHKLPFVAGILQGLAVIPGLSRSGATIFGLSLGRLKPKRILKISYLMSAPVVLIGNAYIAYTEPLILGAWPALITSFLIGILTLGGLMKFSEKINFSKFALIFGVLCILGALFF